MSRNLYHPEKPTPGWLQAAKDSDLTIHLPHPAGDVPMFFRRIPAGEFRTGSRGNETEEEPVHRVVIPQDFYLGTFPVTQAQYRAMAAECRNALSKIEGNEGADPSSFKGDLRPVENVSWDDVMAVGVGLSELKCFREALLKAGLSPDQWQAGLPSEAMWEYACRARTETDYWSGDGEAALAAVGWYYGNSGNETHPVGELPPNAFGLHDMHGNVWEWCQDVWDPKAYRMRPESWLAAPWLESNADDDAKYWGDEADNAIRNRIRVLRGGSWSDAAGGCRLAFRSWYWPVGRDWDGGFRLCVFPGPVKDSKQAESAAGAKARRDDAAVAEVADGAAAGDLSQFKLPAAKRPRKK